MSDSAHLVVTMCVHTHQIVRVGIYSAPASGITGDLINQTMLDGPHVVAESYAKARVRLLKMLQTYPNYRWLYAMLPEGERT